MIFVRLGWGEVGRSRGRLSSCCLAHWLPCQQTTVREAAWLWVRCGGLQHGCPTRHCALPLSLHPVHFRYIPDSCHLQKFSDDTAIVGGVTKGNELEYRGVITSFVEWCGKETPVRQRRWWLTSAIRHQQLQQWTSKEATLRWYLCTNTWVFTSTINWTGHMTHDKKGQSRLHLLRRFFGGVQATVKDFFWHCCCICIFLCSCLLGLWVLLEGQEETQ